MGLPKFTEADKAGFKATYDKHVEERAKDGIPPLPLDPKQCQIACELAKSPPAGQEDFIKDLISNRVPPGVDDASYVKANFLNDILKGVVTSPIISKAYAVELLGCMQGGYNIPPLIDTLDSEDSTLAELAVAG